jgi:hypothetical protein
MPELGQSFVIRGMYNGPEAGCRKALDPLFGLLPKAIAISGKRVRAGN